MKKCFYYFLCLMAFSCSQKKFDDQVLNSIYNQFPNLPLHSPTLTDVLNDDFYSSKINGEKSISYYYRDTVDNKMITMLVFHFPKNNINLLDGYTENWNKGEWDYVMKMKDDTLYSFRSKELEMEFIQGEYEFRRWGQNHLFKRLTPDERIYYDLHRDSLRKVKGNNLPPLPKPTEEERKRWEAMQNK